MRVVFWYIKHGTWRSYPLMGAKGINLSVAALCLLHRSIVFIEMSLYTYLS